MAERLNKKEALEHWHSLPDNMAIKADPIPYKHKGSTYGMDGIRVEGSRQFIDSILSNLKPLLEGENSNTRIGLNYQRVEPKDGKPVNGDWVCYVKTYQRGHEAQMVNAYVSAMTGKESNVSANY